MNHLLDMTRLENRYFAMRHGHSLANDAGLIVSDPRAGCSGYGLSDLGRGQVRAALQGYPVPRDGLLIVSSDFERARETAEMARELLALEDRIAFDARLRERHFGEFEMGSNQAYAAVWQQDAIAPRARYRGVESACEVMARVTALVAELEQLYRGRVLLLVSHGDALQLLQTAFARRDASTHRRLAHLDTAEIRELELA